MNILCKFWYCRKFEQWFNCWHIYNSNEEIIKVYFDVLIHWRSKKCMWSQKIEMDYLHFGFDLRMIIQQLIDCIFYYYVDRYNGRSIVRWLFENWYFVWKVWKHSSIVEVYWLSVAWKTVYMMLLSMWAKFPRWDKKVGCWIGSKNKLL